MKKQENSDELYKYILRYYIDPGFHEDDRIDELLRFCEKGKIEEVMLFCNAEELNSGHITVAELEPWLAMAFKLKKRLDASDIKLSLNPWTTIMHSSRGRMLKPGQNFTLMVGETGKNNGVTVCPLCPEWRSYLSNIFVLMTERLKPVTIWLEDDFRLHNHGSQLGYGGCYCHLHLKEFSEMVEREVTREDILQNIFAPGEPHPWRKMWLDLNNRAFHEAAVMFHAAVHHANPLTRLALMCGLVDTAGTEGRNWHQLQETLGFEPAFMVRPTLSPYTEVWGMRKYPVYARQAIACLKRPLEVYPELESGPRHGPYSKGANYSAFEMLGTALFGANGITINIYDMMGCGTSIDPYFGNKLAQIKPVLNALRKLNIDDNNSCGLNILYRPDIARYIHSTSTENPDGFSKVEKINIDCKGNDGRTPLMLASYWGRIDVVKNLIENKANINAVDTDGASSLFFAVAERKNDVCQYLIKQKADVNIKDAYGQNAILRAIQCDNTEIIGPLLGAGADVNVQDNGGNTPLIIAVQKKQIAIVELLIKKGADVNKRDKKSKTAMDYAGNNTKLKTLLSTDKAKEKK